MTDLISRADALAMCKSSGFLSVEDIATLPAAQVKPLEWVEGDEAGEWESDPYDVWCEFGKFQVYFWSVVMGAPHETEGLAKAAAQAHHETRIRAALIGGEA